MKPPAPLSPRAPGFAAAESPAPGQPFTQPAPRLAAVILAAGLSSRLGEFKPLARLGAEANDIGGEALRGNAGETRDIDGGGNVVHCGAGADETLLGRAARLFRTAGVTDILAVAGHRAPETQAEAQRLGIACVVNPAYAEGMFTSALAGLHALASRQPQADAVFLLPVDIPLVRPHTLRLLAARLAAVLAEAPAEQPAVLHPVFAGLRGHPPLLLARHLPQVLAWTGPNGLRGALEDLERRHGALDVPVADENIRFDVDDQPALAEARRRLARRGIPTPDEALALLTLHDAGQRGHAHARGVAEAALVLARALNAQGAHLDLALTQAAALLHDIAKGQPNHEAAGAALLDSLGFHRAARIVAAHRDIAPRACLPDIGLRDTAPVTEDELVYFADKLVWGSTLVPVRARFQQKLDLYAHDPEANAAIRRRLANALVMQKRIETAARQPLHALLPGTEAR